MNHQPALRQVLSGLLAAACSLATSGAYAISSSAEISNFNIEVIDLNLQDGVSAGYTFSQPTTTLRTYALGTFGTPGTTDERTFASWNAGLESSSFDGTAQSLTRTAADGLLATGSTTDPRSGYSSRAARFDENFTILPNTRLVFTGDFDAVVSTYPCTPPACSVLYASTSFHLYQRNGEIITAAYFNVQTHVGGGPNLSESMNVAFSTGADEWRGIIGMGAVTEGVVPVPEPETYALMLAGLAALALRKRRRLTGSTR